MLFSKKAFAPMLSVTAFVGLCALMIASATQLTATQLAPKTEGQTEISVRAKPRLVGKGKPFIEDFKNYNRKKWYISHGWSNGNFAMNDWQRSQSKFNRGLKLTMGSTRRSKYPFSSGEVQSKTTFGHGYFETTMRVAKGSGLITGFFTYTGEYFKQPHNEIDVEILGKAPNIAELTYYHFEKKASYKHDLGFDASEDFHTYGIDWQPDFIEWYVDDKPVFRVNSTQMALPDRKQKIYFHLLGSLTLNRWAGYFDETAMPATAEFTCASFSESAAESRPCWEKVKAEREAGA